MILWIVGKVIDHPTNSWAMQGVFSTRDKAVAACKTTDFFIYSITLNEEQPIEDAPHPEAVYPLGS